MQESVTDHLNEAMERMHQVESMLGQLNTPRKAPILSVVKEALGHLQKASQNSFQQHVHFALSPECFSPFNLLDITRSYSRFSIHDEARTCMLLQDIVDRNHEEEEKSPGERMKSFVSR